MGKIKFIKGIALLLLYVGLVIQPFAFAFGAETDTTVKTVPKKIIILYNSIGMGHISASKAIEASIKEKDPTAVVIQKNILDFFNPQSLVKLNEKAFWYIVKNHPDTFDKMFRKKMERGRNVTDLAAMSTSYNIDAVRNWLNLEGPSSVIATHYGAAEVLSVLRAQGLLKTTNISWLHTDYFTGYFPRIANAMDRAFVGSTSVRDSFVKSGADESKVIATGIPINPAVFSPIDREAYLKSVNLDPDIRTVVIATGGEGIGDYPKIVKSIVDSYKEPIQIVAVCAKNVANAEALNKLAPSLGGNVTLKVFSGLIPNQDLLNYIKSADVYITKSGGLSPTEAFAIGKPTILLDIYGGHERDNANRFENDRLAVINRDQSVIGEQVNMLLADKELQKEMAKEQLAFRNSFNINEISDYALKPKDLSGVAGDSNFYLGVEGGTRAEGTKEALAKLDKQSPADVEVILSYPASYRGKHFDGPGSNPFGHIGVRVGDKVYTANHIAKPEHEKELMYTTSMDDYLYGIERPTLNAEHTSSFGQAYGRDVVSLRVAGLSKDQLAAMQREAELINQEFRDGKTTWIAKTDNCVNFGFRILNAGGFAPPKLAERFAKKAALPLDMFDSYVKHVQSDLNLKSEIVSYTQVAGSQNMYRTARFPLSFYQLKRSLKNLFFSKNNDVIENRVTKRIAFYSGNKKAQLEDSLIDHQSFSADEKANQPLEAQEVAKIDSELEKSWENLKVQELTSDKLRSEMAAGMATLSDAAKSAVIAGSVEKLADGVEKAKANLLLTKLQQIDNAQRLYQEQYDIAAIAELDYFMKEILVTVEDYQLKMVRGRKDAQATKLSNMYADVKEEYQMYKKYRSQYGQAKDGPTRTRSTRAMFLLGKTYFDAVAGKKVNETDILESGLWIKMKKSAKHYGALVRTFIRVLPSFGKTIFYMIAKPNTAPGKAPATEEINKLLKKFGDELGIQVDVQGRENLPTPKALGKDKVITLVTPTHRDATLDAVVMSNLGLGKALLVMAPDQFLPKKLADKMDAVDSIIGVGRGSDLPINKIIEQLNNKKSDTIVIYPEGSINAGLEESRPLRGKFSEGLIKALLDEGYKVNIVPVTYEGTGRFGHEISNGNLFTWQDKGLKLKAVVNPVIDDTTVRTMFNNFGSQAVSRIIRGDWFATFGSSSKAINGLVRAQEATARLQAYGIPVRSLPAAKKVSSSANMCLSFYGGK